MKRVQRRSKTSKQPRAPVQARAHRRREALLDAAARLVERGGFLALTTNTVAEEAGASVGTVYEYFPNKGSILASLLERYRERLELVLRSAMASEGSWERAADAVVEAFYRYYLQEPGYRALWIGSQLSADLLAAGAAWADDFSAWIAEAIGHWAPEFPAQRRRVMARVVVHLVSTLLTVAVGAPSGERATLVKETQLALRSYLRAHLNAGRA